MRRKNHGSRALNLLESRRAGLISISPTLDLGHGVSVKTMAATAGELSSALTEYNKAVSNLELARQQLVRTELEARGLSERALMAVLARYGRDSNEYAQAGGVKRSDRKRPGDKKKAEAARKLPHHRHAVAPTVPVVSVTPLPAATSHANGVAA